MEQIINFITTYPWPLAITFVFGIFVGILIGFWIVKRAERQAEISFKKFTK
jgi:F0F1-type ATP synthase assembly protein I